MKTVLLLTLFALAAIPTAMASNFDECAVTVEVLTVPEDASLRIRVTEAPLSDFFARCYHAVDKEVEINLYCSVTPTLKIGDSIPLKVMYYAALGEAGPVSGTSWSCVE